MFQYISDWPIFNKIKSVTEKTPEGNLIDYKLLWRDPLDTWVSKGGRTMLIGDAAHPYLPTSGQGAGQSIEDAAVLAIALELAGRDNVKKGLKVAETLRYVYKLQVETSHEIVPDFLQIPTRLQDSSYGHRDSRCVAQDRLGSRREGH